MPDWEKLKVTELKEELKTRGIPLTGLKLKQQLIDKLNEVDSTPLTEENTNGAFVDGDKNKAGLEPLPTKPEPAVVKNVGEETTTNGPSETKPADILLNAEVEPVAHEENGPAQEPSSQQDVELINVEKKEVALEDSVLTPTETQSRDTADSTKEEVHLHGVEDQEVITKSTVDDEPTPTQSALDHASRISSPPPSELLEDQRKRKRRSVTPTPSLTEIQKKAKGINGEALVTKRGDDATNEDPQPGEDRSMEDAPAPTVAADNEACDEEIASEQPTQGQDTEQIIEPPTPLSRSPSLPRDVTPAVHPATKSLYIRNFKRPLHIPTLRSQISTFARSSVSSESEDPIRIFYLDSIRTHAFISFTSISAAARVRNMMHSTRFPDEPLRELLWIDFVPDDKIQEWIDIESDSSSNGFGRGGSRGTKYEVVYTDSPDGITTILQDVDSHVNQQRISSTTDARPTFRQGQSKPSTSRTASTFDAPGIHLDRAGLVPKISAQSERAIPSHHRPSNSKSQPQPPETLTPSPSKPIHNDNSRNFQPLDALFQSTTTKPKLYFKLPSQSVIDDRLDLIKTLYSDRGKSGDPDMKRYSFDTHNGRDEWVDKGPEFGFGRKGTERLGGSSGAPYDGPRGGIRGRGSRGGAFRGRGEYGRLRGDSWRSSGAR